MEHADVQRMADSVLREYGVPLKVAAIVPIRSGWSIAFVHTLPGAPALEVKLQCERRSAHHVRESLKRDLDLTD